jgi:Uma2 family endonuclease
MELALDLNRRYSYADYLTWEDGKRRELIDGYIHIMAPSEGASHQRVSGNLIFKLHSFIRKNKKQCEVFLPIDVCLTINGERNSTEIYNVVQPDICVVCDMSKIDENAGYFGVPDMVIEIQSPFSTRYDFTKKFDLYEAFGVREYWMVSPYKDAECIEVCLLQPDGKYDGGTIYEYGKVPVTLFGGYEIDFEDILDGFHHTEYLFERM